MRILLALLIVLLASCGGQELTDVECPGPDCPGCPGPDCGEKIEKADDFNELNYSAGTTVLYEVQVRTANACHPDVGADWQRSACASKVAPRVEYHGPGCGDLANLEKIKLGTLDDMLEGTRDYRKGITIRYINEKVGANMIWLMPLFPNNDRYDLPDGCDNLGSPYSVRDYFHASGTLSRSCIQSGRDEYSSNPCWANNRLEDLIATAHSRGVKVMLDIALNHFGHNYIVYDTKGFTPIRERIRKGENLDNLWNFNRTEEQNLIQPELLDTPGKLEQFTSQDQRLGAELDALQSRCPDLSGQDLVVAFNAWLNALDWERDQFVCSPVYLEYMVPGFYLGSNNWEPSSHLGDNFSCEWRDVKFLYHQRTNGAHQHEYIRNREYLFRIMNYWVSRGVDGFRLDHTTDYFSGMSPDEWKYIISKVDYYAWRRGQARPIFLAEEFGDQMGMSRVVDIMTEGYVGDITGRNGANKDTHFVERVVSNGDRFNGKTYVMTALETHDELRLLDGTGFNIWTGAGFFGIGAALWSTPMLLSGQEFGEPRRLAFRKSDFIRGRFIGTSSYNDAGDGLVGFYRSMIRARLDWKNRSLVSSQRAFLRTRNGNAVDTRLFAMVKWSGDGNVTFVFHNLWEQDVAQSYYIPPDIGEALWIRDWRSYKLVNVLSGQQMGPCHSGADLKWDLYVEMPRSERLQWLRLETCD